VSVGEITHRRVLGIALPVVLSNATVPLLGLVDTGVVGQLGEAAPIGAVAIGAGVLATFYWAFGFLRMGTTGLVAQAKGAGNWAEVAALLMRGLLVGGGFGLLLLLLRPLVIAATVWISPASAEVEGLARDYLALRLLSAPAAIAVFGINGWLIGQERTRSLLLLQLWTNGLNLVLDVWFVLGLGWGVQGVAGATAIAEWSGLGLGLWLCRDAFQGTAWRDPGRVFDGARLRRMAAVNGDIMIRTMLLEAVFLSFLLWGARQGDVALAANQVLVQLLALTAYALDGFAFAAETLVGQAVGARRLDRLREGVRVAAIWGLAVALALALSFAIFGPWAIRLMTTAPEVRAAALVFLPWVIAGPIMGIASWMLDGIFIGATRTADMRNMMAVAAAVYFAVAWPLVEVWGNHGLWLALHVSWVARAATLWWRYPALERAVAVT
jgi:MATE family multidrug resistance protein